VNIFRCGVRGREGFQLTSAASELFISSRLIVQGPVTASRQKQAAPEDLSALSGKGRPPPLEGLADEGV